MYKQGEDQMRDLASEISNYEHRSEFVLKPKQSRKLNRIPIYDLKGAGGGTIKKYYKILKLREWRREMGIKTTNSVIGFTPNHIGFQPGTQMNGKNYILEVLIKNKSALKIKFPSIMNVVQNRLINYREVWTGSPDTNTGHLKRMLVNNSVDQYSVEDLLCEMKDSPWLRVPTVDISDPKEMFWCTNYNKNAHNGHITSRVIGCPKKGYSILGAVRMAIQTYHLIRKRPMRNFCLWDVLAREKDCKIGSNTENISYSSRVVLNPEHHVTHLLSWVFQGFMKAYEFVPEEQRNFIIEGEFDGAKATILNERIKGYDLYVDADWTSFDSSIDTNWIIAAGSIMFGDSCETKEDKRFFYHIISSMVTKYVAIPPGIVVELNRANASGHPGVTALNCIVNLMRWILIGKKIYGDDYHKNMFINVYGDDAIIAFKDTPKLYEMDNIIENLGFQSDPIVPNLHSVEPVVGSEHSCPDFLKRRFMTGGIYWNRDKLLDKLIYQSKKRSPLEQCQLMKSFVETGPFDIEMNEFLSELVNLVRNKNEIIEEVKFKPDFGRFVLGKSKDYLRGYNKELGVCSHSEEVYLGNKVKSLAVINAMEWKQIFYQTIDPKFVEKFRIKEKFDLNKVDMYFNTFITCINFGIGTKYFNAILQKWLL